MEDIKVIQYQQVINEFLTRVSNHPLLIEHRIKVDTLKDNDANINIAFVGQYNAGKSTIIRILTGNETIQVGSGVTTNVVNKYPYKGINIWDTPGILAGEREHHDTASFKAMDESDLLVYVITNELFDPVVGAAFRDLCFTKGREKEILLVVNKSENDSGSPEVKIASMAKIFEPRNSEDFPIVFVDAESYFDAIDEDDAEDKAELQKISNIHGLVAAIDSFTEDRGLLGKLTTPMSLLHTQLLELNNKLSVEDPEQEVLIELLHRRLRILKASERQFNDHFQNVVGKELSAINIIGDELSESVQEGADVDEFKDLQTKSCKDTDQLIFKAQSSVVDLVETTLDMLNKELADLEASPLALDVKRMLAEMDFDAKSVTAVDGRELSEEQKCSNKTKALLSSTEKGLVWFSKQAVNNTVKAGAKAASGSNVHKAVLEVGHFFGTKFKPHQAVKIADKLGKGAKFIGPAMAIFGVIVQIYDDRQQEKYSQEMLNTRRDIRKAYRSIASDLESEFNKEKDKFIQSVYIPQVTEISTTLSNFRDASGANIDSCKQLEELIAEIEGLRSEMNGFEEEL